MMAILDIYKFMSALEVNEIANNCIKIYNDLPKSGKPKENEWTVLSCFVQRDKIFGAIKVVSLGTGSKCVGATKMSPSGNIVNDSHAETLARRGLLLYLYSNITQCLNSQESVFTLEDSYFKLKSNIEFLFYSSQLPCGDASILPKDGCEEMGDLVISLKRNAQTDDVSTETKPNLVDIHRTGAKCLPSSKQDPKLPGKDYHVLGQVRTKPGRGDRTLSVSCSDKIAKWIQLGVQGSLLSLLLTEPIYISHFIFGAGVPFSKDSLTRALVTRNESHLKPKSTPHFYQCVECFPNIKSDKKLRPAPNSIIWIYNFYLRICKYNLYKSFQNILMRNKIIEERICKAENLEDIPYNRMKRKAITYNDKWAEVKKNFFKIWPTKPDMFDFCIKNY
ncbi:unnamed protein product, partial [Leptidea sinapis]